ncbi:hypothetical protein BDF20DRAFT_916857 [Mycotypha africana]|uniref:uncharacterized protein n=1 Tax=Mycotypha africana TaxID=64632 RepID=UPI0023002C9F|nr:uncharacterized protein BDF20DRAFT_916857 [Mycotypha africana]KAI8968312.1 hypothetical protein BDF20DRAFT_916857 [Mycotypha africana]
MSNNNSNETREYVKSYIKNTYAQDILESEQPKFDPNRSTSAPPLTAKQQTDEGDVSSKSNLPTQENISAHLNIHLPTHNPIPSSSTTNRSTDTVQNKKQDGNIEYTLSAQDFKEQRIEIHEAATTNCVDLQEELFQCFQHGSWWDKAKMCEEQKQKFWACFQAQKAFLKEVNYKSPFNTQEQDDRILARALKLREKIDNSNKE